AVILLRRRSSAAYPVPGTGAVMKSVAGMVGVAVVVVTAVLSGRADREATVALDRISVNVVDERGRQPRNTEARIFEARHHRPILAPGGRHLTFGRCLEPHGELTVRCTPEGTVLRFAIGGLIPDGSYSLWSFVFDPPGWTPSMEWATGAGGLGSATRVPQVFTASISGDAFVALTVPGGPMS